MTLDGCLVLTNLIFEKIFKNVGADAHIDPVKRADEGISPYKNLFWVIRISTLYG